MKVNHYIIETQGQYCIVRIYDIAGAIHSKPVAYCKTVKEAEALLEDGVPANAASVGQIASIGIGPDGEPGVDLKKKRKWALIRRILRPNLVGKIGERN